MKFSVKFAFDDMYGTETTINVSVDKDEAYQTLLPAKARLVGMAMMRAADAADATGGAQAEIDALLASADPGDIVVPEAE